VLKKITCAISGFISSFGLIFCIIVLTFLSLGSLLISYTFNAGKEIGDRLTLTSAPLHFFLSCLLLCCMIALLLFLYRREKLPSWKKFLIVGCVVVFILELCWIFMQNTSATLEPDSKRLLEFASGIASGNKQSYFNDELPSNVSDMLDGTLYLAQYPYNIVAELYFLLITRAVGSLAPIVFQVLSALCGTVSIAVLAFIFAEFEQDNKKRVVCVLLLCLCFPNILYSGLIYCNQVGLFFVLFFVLFNIKAMKSDDLRKRILYVCASFVPFMLMCWIKSTFLIVGIAVLICWVIYALNVRSLRGTAPGAICLAVILVANVSVAIPISIMEKEIGYSCGEGTPKITFIAMGLQHEYNTWSNHPGWWNRYNNNIFEQTNGNYEEMEKLSAESIQERLTYLFSNPKEGVSFFKEKLSSEWCAVDFGATYYSSLNLHYDEYGNLVKFIPMDSEGSVSQEGTLAKGLITTLNPFMHAHMLFVYVFAGISCILLLKRRKEIDTYKLILPCIFAVGFFVYIWWEAKAQYALPFFMVLIPLSVSGFFEAVERIKLHKKEK
jgi:hypothetical protein